MTGIGATDAYLQQIQATQKNTQVAQMETQRIDSNRIQQQQEDRRMNENTGDQPLAAGGTLGTKINVLV